MCVCTAKLGVSVRCSPKRKTMALKDGLKEGIATLPYREHGEALVADAGSAVISRGCITTQCRLSLG